MKTLKLSKPNPQIDRKLVSKMGDALYHAEGVDSIEIKLNFKDGSTIGYKRSENRDTFDKLLKEGEDEN